ncbi:hypothetical protein Pd630_LPD15018 (plasmid) [Rhodococcus opacus PD630]|nr:hypothetical protein Pd630_LPD15018 [Rhodococcus opacus PD630]
MNSRCPYRGAHHAIIVHRAVSVVPTLLAGASVCGVSVLVTD